jgi:hypothetical protein
VLPYLLLAFGMIGALGCRRSELEVATDRRVYRLSPRDSVASVRLTLRNHTGRPVYLLTADGQADVLIMIRVPTTAPESWSTLRGFEAAPLPKMDSVRLGPDSSHHSSFMLHRGDYRILVPYGDSPGAPAEHGEWVKRFSVR